MQIGVDFDGTLVSYKGFQGMDHIGDLLPGAAEWLQELKAAGHTVVIFTARATDPEGLAFVRRYVREHNLTEVIDGITGSKLYSFDLFLDDRALRFEGTYPTMQELATTRPWWKALTAESFRKQVAQ